MSDVDNPKFKAVRRRQRRLSPIWIVPIVAIMIGLWLVYDTIASRGPLITLEMTDAEGIEAGSTLIKLLNVEVGRVEQVSLSEDLNHTLITARMAPNAERMLSEDSRFWVVKPRIGRDGISGLGTVLSGVYIQLQPGNSAEESRHFQVLAQPPVAANAAEGIRIRLESEVASALRVGDPVTYQGFNVGLVEEAVFDPESRQMRHQLFIETPYDGLITENTRFWTTSGLDMRLDAEGIRFNVESLEALLIGGVTFGYLEGVPLGSRVTEGSRFTLYRDEESARQDSFYHFLEYALLMDNTVRGLSAGAPVQFRGVRVGTVVSSPWQFNIRQGDSLETFQIPVLIRIEPQRLDGEADMDQGDLDAWATHFEQLFQRGLTASLKAGNLLTGAMFVDLDFQSDTNYVAADFAGRPVFPSSSSSLAQIEAQVTALLEKLNDLQLEPVIGRLDLTLASADQAMEEIQQAAASFRAMVEAPSSRALPDNLEQSLASLQNTLSGFAPGSATYQDINQTIQNMERLLRQLQPLASTLSEQPNALIFDRRPEPDPQPQAPSR